MSSKPPKPNALQPNEIKQEPVRLFVTDEQLFDPILTGQAALPRVNVKSPWGWWRIWSGLN